MRKEFIIIIVFFSLSLLCSLAKDLTEGEMKNLIKQIVNVQIRTYNFRQANQFVTISPHFYDYYDLERLKKSLNSSIDLKDIIKMKEIKKDKNIVKIFKVFYFEMRTWFIIAFGNDGSYYLLRNFDYNHFNNLIVQKIGKPTTIDDFLNIGQLYINTVQYSDLGFRNVVNTNEYHNLKKKFRTILLPILYSSKGDTIFEFCSFQKENNKVNHHKLIFKDGLIQNVEETPDGR